MSGAALAGSGRLQWRGAATVHALRKNRSNHEWSVEKDAPFFFPF